LIAGPIVAIGVAIQKSNNPPKLWVNAASATIYPMQRYTEDESFTDFENDFSVQVCQLWEKTFYDQQYTLYPESSLADGHYLRRSWCDDSIF
jgi:NAD dependent epimerase/dehydratase family enzyme